MDLEEMRERQWVRNWAGNWSLLTCTYFGDQYTRTLEEELGTHFHHTVLVCKNHFSSCFYLEEELDAFGNFLAQRVVEEKEFAFRLCGKLKRRADGIRAAMAGMRANELDEIAFRKHVQLLYEYVAPHVAVKRVVDYLPPEQLEKLLPLFQEARVHAESVYAETEEFTRAFAAAEGKRTGIASDLFLCLTKEELENYFAEKTLPEEKQLRQRLEFSALVFEDGGYELVAGEKAHEVEAAVLAVKQLGELRGKTAFPGVVTGRVKIVFDPQKATGFKDGDVLVTSMTRPEFLPLLKKAGAFVTDAGGMLSHAAITARELKKPCVVGTEAATKVLKEGELVEVDAGKGLVRKIG